MGELVNLVPSQCIDVHRSSHRLRVLPDTGPDRGVDGASGIVRGWTHTITGRLARRPLIRYWLSRS